MPRRRQARRFEPRYGVSRAAIDAEASFLTREVQDYLVYSLNDLRQRVVERRSTWQQSDEHLKCLVLKLPERERLAVQCLLSRDAHHLAELYLSYLGSHVPEETAPLTPPEPTSISVTPFSEWLFGEK